MDNVIKVLIDLGATPFNVVLLYIIYMGMGELKAMREAQENLLNQLLQIALGNKPPPAK